MSLPTNPFTSSFIPSTNASSLSSKARGKQIRVEETDRISELYDDLLVKILSNLCTEDAIKTSVLSHRWENAWKQVPGLIFNMEHTVMFRKPRVSQFDLAQMITKVIQNHNIYLECCKILHFPYQCEDGTLEIWIQTLTQVKNTKCLAFQNMRGDPCSRGAQLQLSPNIFSHPSLTSLFLCRYYLQYAHAFNNCHNLTTLKLYEIGAEVGVFNTVIASCPSLKVLELDITWRNHKGCLKIHNKNLKLLVLICTRIDQIDVGTPILDILAIHCNFVTTCNFLLVAPRIFVFKKFCWILEGIISHMHYNVSSDAQEIKNIWHEFMVNKNPYYFTRFKTLAVNMDLTNPQDVYMLKEVCDAWRTEMEQLKICFKHNNIHKEEGESSISRAQQNKAKEGNFFISADFRVKVVWMYKLSDFNEEEFALASLLVTQTVTHTLMIETSSIPANKKLKTEEAMARLMELPKGNKELIIKFF